MSQNIDKLNLLIVDDEAEILTSLNIEFRKTFKIFSAESATRALEILRQNEINIALCDERLPGESGSDLLASIKVEYPDIIRLLFSGYTDATAIMNAINKANVFKFIVKPWGKELEKALEEAQRYHLSKIQNQYKDSLTNLQSERAIFDALHSEVKRSNRYKTQLSTILLNISNPKVNSELHSFLVDKFLIKKIAEILRHELRESDAAGRLKDNNFLILLTETDKNGANIFLSRFHTKIEEFESKTNKGLLPFKIKTSQHTLIGDKIKETETLISILYSQLNKAK